MATDSNKKILAENLRQAAYKQDKIRKEADATAEALEGKVITIGTKAGTTGRIFGAVTAVQVAEALAANGFTVDRRRITFDNDIKDLGEHTANLNLHKEVKIKVALNVVSE